MCFFYFVAPHYKASTPKFASCSKMATCLFQLARQRKGSRRGQEHIQVLSKANSNTHTYSSLISCWPYLTVQEIERRSVRACVLSRFSCVRVCVALQTVAPQAPLSMGVLQARILQWVSMPSSRGSFRLRSNPRLVRLLHWQVDSSPLVPPGKPERCNV